MAIYSSMKKDWETYCLMAGVMFIEEMSKPNIDKQTKGGRDYICYRSLRLKGKDYNTIKMWFDITKTWEKKLKTQLIGESFDDVKVEGYSKQYYFLFSPNWLYYLLTTIKRLPSGIVQDISVRRLKNWKKGKDKFILSKKELEKDLNYKTLYNRLYLNKFLAAGAMIVSFDLEFRGISNGRPSLCMSDKYKDFLEYMLTIANKFNWATQNKLSSVSVEYSKKLGINASPQFEFRISSKKLKEIYELAGPLSDPVKDKAISFHANRSCFPTNKPNIKNKNKKHIYELLKQRKANKTTELQYYVNIGTDVILDHLHNLEKEGKINKIRKGKRYLWSVKDAS